MICAFCGRDEATKMWPVYYTDWKLPICGKCDPHSEIDAPGLKWDKDRAVEFVVSLTRVPARVARLMLAVATDSNIPDGADPCEEADVLVAAVEKRVRCDCGRSCSHNDCRENLFPEEERSLPGYEGTYCSTCVEQLRAAVPLESIPDGETMKAGIKYVCRMSDGTAYLTDLEN